MTKREHKIIDINDDPLVNWLVEPIFDFRTEVEALQMLEAIRDELDGARKHVRHCMRYLSAAVKVAREEREDGERTSKETIITYSGLARQTVYDMLASAAAERGDTDS